MKRDEIMANPAVVLGHDQREAFFEQGYLSLPGLIDVGQLAPLRTALSELVDRSREQTSSGGIFDLEPGHSPDHPRLRRATHLDDVDPVFWSLCSESVIPDVAVDLLGPDLRFRDAFANFKWAGGGVEVDWHQDIAFYPHTNFGTCQFLLSLEDVGPDQGPLEVVPGSHRGVVYEHYDEEGEWTGSIRSDDLARAGVDRAVALTGPAGSLTVHHSCTIHGSSANESDRGRPVIVITYSAADAIPYTAAPYRSSHYGMLVRGTEPRHAHHAAARMPLPPDWSSGYTSIFSHQERDPT